MPDTQRGGTIATAMATPGSESETLLRVMAMAAEIPAATATPKSNKFGFVRTIISLVRTCRSKICSDKNEITKVIPMPIIRVKTERIFRNVSPVLMP